MEDGHRPLADALSAPVTADDDAVMLDESTAAVAQDIGRKPTAQGGHGGGLLDFKEVKDHGAKKGLTQTAKVPIPPHRMTPLKRSWPTLYSPLVEEMGLLVRVNPQARRVELKTSKHTRLPGALAKATAFLQAFALGFTPEDSLAILRLEDIYVESFEIKDVKSLSGDHLSRAIGRIAGKDGRTRFTIENTSRTRIVLADTKIHILGTFSAIKVARDAVCALILGSPPGKVYHGLRTVAARQRERF